MCNLIHQLVDEHSRISARRSSITKLLRFVEVSTSLCIANLKECYAIYFMWVTKANRKKYFESFFIAAQRRRAINRAKQETKPAKRSA